MKQQQQQLPAGPHLQQDCLRHHSLLLLVAGALKYRYNECKRVFVSDSNAAVGGEAFEVQHRPADKQLSSILAYVAVKPTQVNFV
jgi:hypothetical protein